MITRWFLLIILSLCLLEGCKNDNSTDPVPASDSTEQTGSPQNVNDDVEQNQSPIGENQDSNTTGINPQMTKVAIVGAGNAEEMAEGWVTLCVAGVYEASIQGANGQELVTTGTLTQATLGVLSFTYTELPNDRLKIVAADGVAVECRISAMDGNFDGNDPESFANNFLGKDHVLSLNIFETSTVDLDITSNVVSGEINESMKGTVKYDGTAYQVNLTSQGSETWQPDAAELRRDVTVSGTIKTDGFSVAVNESDFFKSIYVDNLVINRDRTINNTWTIGTDTYSLQNVRMRTSEINGKASEIQDYWIVTGQLLKNNQVIAPVEVTQNPISIKIIVNADGEEIILATFEI